jgi:transposase
MQVEVITGAERRRKWTREQKEAILAEAFAPGAVARAVARQNDISSGQLYGWRKELWEANRIADFARVTVADTATTTALSVRACELPAIEIEMCGSRVRIPATMPPVLAAAIVKALASCR